MALELPRTVVSHQVDHDTDPEGEQRGYIRATDYSLPYASQWSRMHHDDCGPALLRQLNCSFLSTPDVPPTLLALKQHAQALCLLLHRLVPARGAVDANDDATVSGAHGAGDQLHLSVRATPGDAFDWLADLETPYTNDDPDHQKPLHSLTNEVRGRSDAHGTEYHCPLLAGTGPRPRAAGEPTRPFASHHGLIMHANACLERLDHEFSSEGGLMGLLPTDDAEDEADRRDARNSLLGQWLVFTQHLVGRMHELEVAYGNALDALAGEAAAPLQHLSAVGPDGRAGAARPIGYPQDRWLLVNAGDDVFGHVHDLLDRQEALAEEKERVWRRNGVSGARRWAEERGGRTYARGIVPVNLMTRYYRLAGSPNSRGTLFVLPAYEHHPAVEHSRKLEASPTVVAAPQPMFPQRASELERRYDQRLEHAADLERDNADLRSELASCLAQLSSIRADLERERAANRALEAATGKAPRQEEEGSSSQGN